jgi:hypothetical protein
VTGSSESKDTLTDLSRGGEVAPDPADRPSRRGWPLRTQATTTTAGTHDHQLPQGIFRVLIALCVFLLVLAVVDAFLVLYIVGRGQVREAQIEETRRDVREQLCDVLDGLPQGGVLDLTRSKLDCGPGLPLSSFPPDIQRQFTPAPTQPSAPVPAQPTTTPRAAPEPPQDATPAPVQPSTPDDAAPLPGGAGPIGTPEPPPSSPPSQVRDLVCGLLPVCPKENP